MSNVFRLNSCVPVEKWISMSNQGTDFFLELLIKSSESTELTVSQKNLVEFLRERLEINRIAPGTAGFDLDEMPWAEASFSEDLRFLQLLVKRSRTAAIFAALGVEQKDSVTDRFLEKFGNMISEFSEMDLKNRAQC